MALREHPGRLKADPQLALELEVCHDYKIFHSEFLAKSQDDRDKAIWAHLRARQTCPRCHTRAEEWEPAKGGDRAAYRAVAKVCRGCQELQSREDTLPKEQRTRGMFVTLIRQEATHGEQA